MACRLVRKQTGPFGLEAENLRKFGAYRPSQHLNTSPYRSQRRRSVERTPAVCRKVQTSAFMKFGVYSAVSCGVDGDAGRDNSLSSVRQHGYPSLQKLPSAGLNVNFPVSNCQVFAPPNELTRGFPRGCGPLEWLLRKRGGVVQSGSSQHQLSYYSPLLDTVLSTTTIILVSLV